MPHRAGNGIYLAYRGSNQILVDLNDPFKCATWLSGLTSTLISGLTMESWNTVRHPYASPPGAVELNNHTKTCISLETLLSNTEFALSEEYTGGEATHQVG